MAETKHLFLFGYILSGALCSDYTAQMPHEIEALGGSCVLIPCTFTIPDDVTSQLTKPAVGVWIKQAPQFKNAGIVVFNSSRTDENKLRGEILGDLIKNNCTTVLDNIPGNYTDKYYFRIETGFKATCPKSPVKIIVKDSPHKPNISTLKYMEENTPVNLTCSVKAPCHKLLPVLTWSPRFENIRDQLLEDSFSIKYISSVLTITPSHLDHGKKITCLVQHQLQTAGQVKTAEETITLNVLFPPKNTTAFIRPSGPVVNGSHVTLTCSSKANPPVSNFTWFTVTRLKPTLRGFGPTLNVSSSDFGTYYCEAQNQQGKQTSEGVQLGGTEEPSYPQVIGGVIGAMGMLLLCVLLLLYWRRRKYRESHSMNSKRIESKEEQRNSTLNTSTATKTGETKEVLESQEEEVQYAEIEFKLQNKQNVRRCRAQMEEGAGQECEYSVIQATQRKGQSAPESLYALVGTTHHL
ncbi:hypothetical protein AGOR_G00174450 [Albula goreensis]|uniref:Ig-like domain-containing protein n=1 Tax=Albula goreensis TaxID=1534307 RepID=A0A8T3CZ26_9TELE|nr:hypothetical protein AGOR_G00174450 [Albula goreensis]